MALTRSLGTYALVRGAFYFLGGAGALVVGTGSLAMGTVDGVGTAVLGGLFLIVALALFAGGGLLYMHRKIGRLFSVVLLSADALLQGATAYTTGSFFAGLFAVCSVLTVSVLVVRNPLGSDERPTIDDESNAHDIGVEDF